MQLSSVFPASPVLSVRWEEHRCPQETTEGRSEECDASGSSLPLGLSSAAQSTPGVDGSVVVRS